MYAIHYICCIAVNELLDFVILIIIDITIILSLMSHLADIAPIPSTWEETLLKQPCFIVHMAADITR